VGNGSGIVIGNHLLRNDGGFLIIDTISMWEFDCPM